MELMNTLLGDALQRAIQLKHAEIWKEVFKDSDFKEEILDWIRWDQLYNEGVDELGEIIGTYSTYTEILNPEKQAGTPYTLYDTGAFYRSMTIAILDLAIEIDADPIKTDEFGQTTDLFAEYGEGIIGLTDESKQKLVEELIIRYQNEASKLLQGDR
jgi:hypothetical protein